jgi:hypothetical protein
MGWESNQCGLIAWSSLAEHSFPAQAFPRLTMAGCTHKTAPSLGLFGESHKNNTGDGHLSLSFHKLTQHLAPQNTKILSVLRFATR